MSKLFATGFIVRQMKKYLKKLYESQTLTKQEAREVLLLISEGKTNHSEMASLLTVYLMRPISVEELAGYRDVLLELCVPVNIDAPSIDVCGTGGADTGGSGVEV